MTEGRKSRTRRRVPAAYDPFGAGTGNREKHGMLGWQTGVCVAVLCSLLAGWVSNAGWFFTGREELLALMEQPDQARQVSLALSDFLGRRPGKGEAVQTTAGTAVTRLESEEIPGASPEKLAELYRYIEEYGQKKGQSLPAGTGGYLPVSVSAEDKTYPAPDGCLLSPIAVSAEPKLPLRTGVLTSAYGYRLHPITGELDFHTGIDLAAAEGSRIGAAWPGVVAQVGWSDVYGNYVLVSHSAGLATFYAHCLNISVEEGMILRQGEKLGEVGSTGLSTGPHLHWEIRAEGMRADPAWILGHREGADG